jgi:hypothetical protein
LTIENEHNLRVCYGLFPVHPQLLIVNYQLSIFN